MIGAKDILVKILGENKQFKASMAGASGSMKTFATTTQTSSATAATSTKAMSMSMAASLALATVGLTAVIAGVVALVGALGKATAAAAEDQEATARTVALLEKQGIAWDETGDHILNYIEDLERLTLFGDTELQTSFNELISAGMDVEGALEGMSAAAALANGTEMSLAGATKALGNEYATGTSRLRSLGYETETYGEMLDLINSRVGDGSQVTETASGKFELLKIELMDQAKLLANDFLPVITDVLEVMIWGAKNVLPPLIHGFKILLIPIKSAILGFKILINTAEAAWEALNGNFDVAKEHLKANLQLAKDFNEETKNTILNIQEETVASADLGTQLRANLDIEEDIKNAIDDQTDATNKLAEAREKYTKSIGMRRAEAGIDVTGLSGTRHLWEGEKAGRTGYDRPSGDWTISYRPKVLSGGD